MGFMILADEFRKWLEESPQTDTFIITGGLTHVAALFNMITNGDEAVGGME